MRLSRHLRLVLPAAFVVGATCSFPTDESTGMYVSVTSPTPVLLRGSEVELTAHVWIRRDNGDSTRVPNAQLLWTTNDETLATVRAVGGSTGRVTGVNPGMVEIRAVAPGFEGASAGVYALRVANPLEIDSVSPDTVRYGERLRIFGVGVGSLFFAGLGNGTLEIDSLAILGNPDGLSARSFWVSYPTSSGRVLAAGSGQLVTAPEPTIVLPFDLYEPNESTPAVLALDAAPPYPALPTIRFYNPALAYEDLRGGAFGFDWYRWTTATPAQPYTFVLVAPALGAAQTTYLTNPSNPAAWRVGPGQYDCKGVEFRPAVARADSIRIALKRLPGPAIDLVSAYIQLGRYALAVLQGYEVSDKRIEADRFEENDTCQFADENFADPVTRIDLTTEFSDVLTIDTPHDIDWLRFSAGSTPKTVTISTVAHPLSSPDRSDIDLYLWSVPGGNQQMSLIASDVGSGSTAKITAVLAPGDYYLAVVDSAGVPTRYGMCMAWKLSCSPPPPPAIAAAAAPAMTSHLAPALAPARRQWGSRR